MAKIFFERLKGLKIKLTEHVFSSEVIPGKATISVVPHVQLFISIFHVAQTFNILNLIDVISEIRE